MKVTYIFINELTACEYQFSATCKLLFDDLYKEKKPVNKVAIAIDLANVKIDEALRILNKMNLSIVKTNHLYVFVNCRDKKQINELVERGLYLRYTTVGLYIGDAIVSKNREGFEHVVCLKNDYTKSDVFHVAENVISSIK
jgi:hypothetical protein